MYCIIALARHNGRLGGVDEHLPQILHHSRILLKVIVRGSMKAYDLHWLRLRHAPTRRNTSERVMRPSVITVCGGDMAA